MTPTPKVGPPPGLVRSGGYEGRHIPYPSRAGWLWCALGDRELGGGDGDDC